MQKEIRERIVLTQAPLHKVLVPQKYHGLRSLGKKKKRSK